MNCKRILNLPGLKITIDFVKVFDSLRSNFLFETSETFIFGASFINPLRPTNDLSQTSHSNIKGLSVCEVMRIENKITPVKFY